MTYQKVILKLKFHQNFIKTILLNFLIKRNIM